MGINATLLGEMITFAIFVFVTMKYIWPPIANALRERQKKIADGLAAAERGEHTLELAQNRSADMLRQTKEESAHLIDKTNTQANKIIDEAKTRGKKEGKQMIVNAQAEITQQIQNAKKALQQETINITMAGVEKILKKEIDQKTHDKMLGELINSVTANRET